MNRKLAEKAERRRKTRRATILAVVYAIWVQLVARQSGLTLVHCAITTSWDDQIILASDEVSSLCRPGCLDYSPDEVLNERIESYLLFHSRGHLVKGTI